MSAATTVLAAAAILCVVCAGVHAGGNVLAAVQSFDGKRWAASSELRIGIHSLLGLGRAETIQADKFFEPRLVVKAWLRHSLPESVTFIAEAPELSVNRTVFRAEMSEYIGAVRPPLAIENAVPGKLYSLDYQILAKTRKSFPLDSVLRGRFLLRSSTRLYRLIFPRVLVSLI